MTSGRGAGKLAAMAEAVGEAGVRELVAGWLAAERPGEDGPGGGEPADGGWAVPPAAGSVVVAAARRLAGAGPGPGGTPSAAPEGLRLIAEALVVDEHPSAGAWTERERAEAVEWVALLLDRFGEDGVTMLTAELAGEAQSAGSAGPAGPAVPAGSAGESGVGDPESGRASAG
ncbi:hypothetical protein OG401_07250 [Kitasatospora purpeofusca]|uniref:hypothetical protein n=1 Tax=Kitasatospora purpeofusca TaxID=67352 RepID=UPI0022525A2E|nr:hypothetical protein [Kitasatospora purpeofusca]MCX4684108.1 hypothetical protein [Kitasatospora purpeofusca]